MDPSRSIGVAALASLTLHTLTCEICPLAFSGSSLLALTPSRLEVLGQCLYGVKTPLPLQVTDEDMSKTCRLSEHLCNRHQCSALTRSVNLVLLCDTGQKSQWKFFLPLTCLLAFIVTNGGREREREGGKLSKL